MTVVTDTQQNTVLSHLSSTEQLRVAQSGGDYLLVVTDRRVLTIRETTAHGEVTQSIEKTFLSENIADVLIERRSSNSYDGDRLVGAVVVLTIGLLTTGFATFLQLGGLSLLLGGLTITVATISSYEAFQTPAGTVRVTLTRPDGERVQVYLLDDGSDVAVTISRTLDGLTRR